VQATNYYPSGTVIAESPARTDQGIQPYKFGSKELDRTNGLDFYDFEWRLYDPAVGRFLTMDPMAEKYYSVSPYAYCLNNPVKYIDPTGLAPIYAPDGTFLGTDEDGLQGCPLILNRADFTQGMARDDAQKVLWTGELTKKARAKMDEHVAGLSSRPDYDGVVSIAEGIAWAKDHPGALDNPTPDNTLYIDAAKCNFGFLSTSDFKYDGVKEPQNLFTDKNLAAAAINPGIAATVYALGAVDMILLDKDKKTVKVVNNSATDYDWNTGGTVKRDRFIRTNNFLTGINPQIHGFKTYYYGIGRLRK
jgi:RHS repeat-associated protein